MTASSFVLLAEELAPSFREALGASLPVREVDGTDRAALLAALPGARALVVRSATVVDAEVLAAGTALEVVARAGIGLDNVDVQAATARGVLVVNAPLSNVVSAAEQAVALALAVCRHTASASAALKAGRWERARWTGIELEGKTVGVLGLGRIGVLVAQRLAAFGTHLLAYDPYVAPARAAALGVELVDLDTLLRRSDLVSVHLPRTPETMGLIGERELQLCKPGLRLVNAARGGLVDEDALLRALQDGRVAGAGLDVFTVEPCTDSPLFGRDDVVVTPHLGASTVEAQDKAGVAVARSLRLALAGDLVPDAVNLAGAGAVDETLRPWLPLVETLGRVVQGLAHAAPTALEVQVRGELAAAGGLAVLELAALKGLLATAVEEPVTYVNAPGLARERGVEVLLTSTTDSPDHRSEVLVVAVLQDGARIAVSGTLSGRRGVHRLTGVLGHEVDVPPSQHLLFVRYADRPGVVGEVGAALGAASVNIAGAQVARSEQGGSALMVMTVDSPVPAQVLERLRTAIAADDVRAVTL